MVDGESMMMRKNLCLNFENLSKQIGSRGTDYLLTVERSCSRNFTGTTINVRVFLTFQNQKRTAFFVAATTWHHRVEITDRGDGQAIISGGRRRHSTRRRAQCAVRPGPSAHPYCLSHNIIIIHAIIISERERE